MRLGVLWCWPRPGYRCWRFVPRWGFGNLDSDLCLGNRYISTHLIVSVPFSRVSRIPTALICGHFPVQEAQVMSRAVRATWWLRAGSCAMISLNAIAIETEAVRCCILSSHCHTVTLLDSRVVLKSVTIIFTDWKQIGRPFFSDVFNVLRL